MLRRTLVLAAAALCVVPLGCEKKSEASGEGTNEPAASAETESAPVAEEKKAEEPAEPEKAPKQLLVGKWTYASVEFPGVPDDKKKMMNEALKKSSMEFTADEFKTFEDGKERSGKKYEVVSEKGREIVVKLNPGGDSEKEETYTFEDDDTLVMKHAELGKVVLKRSEG